MENVPALAGMTGPLAPGVRVSLELPLAGTCVAVVTSQDDTTLILELLDEMPDGELEEGSRLDLFMPRREGVYHWPCSLSAAPRGSRAEVELLNLPMFVQRRLGHRLEASLQAEVRRVHASRRGRPREVVVADLSHGGLKAEGDCQLSTGDTIEVTMHLGARVQVAGRVVMAHPTGPGQWTVHVSFLDGQPDASAAIDKYIDEQMRGRATTGR